jgi:hypothetical protein
VRQSSEKDCVRCRRMAQTGLLLHAYAMRRACLFFPGPPKVASTKFSLREVQRQAQASQDPDWGLTKPKPDSVQLRTDG